MTKNFSSLTEKLSQPLPPEFETVSGKLPYTLLNDMMFRIVFESSEDALKKLLCALLHMNYSDITDVKINNPILLGDRVIDKSCILDLSIILNKTKKIHLELQVLKILRNFIPPIIWPMTFPTKFIVTNSAYPCYN